jgi:hypothetical protein
MLTVFSCATGLKKLIESDDDYGILIEEPDSSLVLYEGEYLNIFFHPLVSRPQVAFRSSLKDHFLEWFVTVNEYRKILHEMYQKNYVLVNINELYEVTYVNGAKRVTIKKIILPEGKKPLVLSIDDLNYYPNMRRYATVHKLVLDENGEIAAWTDNGRGGVLSYDLDCITVLEDFIKKNPDFSLRGARGIIALTGYHGLLGHRTHQIDAPGYQQEVNNVKQVINKLKQMGWVFGCHGYAHLDMAEEPIEAFREDIELWFTHVQPILGDTDLFIYPYGSKVEGMARHRFLRSRNFNLFFGVGTGLTFEHMGEHIYLDRKNIDGTYFREYKNRADRLFDIEKVIDIEYR